jgi:hypothetical protein
VTVAERVRKTITVTLRISGIRETIRAFNQLPDDASQEMRAASLSIAGVVAADVRTAARRNPQSALMAPTVRAQKDRVPVVVAGGTRRVGRNRVPAYKVLFGSEFGAHSLKQYRAFNSNGYWFFETFNAKSDYISREYIAAADEVLAKWGRGG